MTALEPLMTYRKTFEITFGPGCRLLIAGDSFVICLGCCWVCCVLFLVCSGVFRMFRICFDVAGIVLDVGGFFGTFRKLK